MEKDYDIELIEQYLHGELEEEGVASFDRRMVSEPEFAKAVKEQALIMDGIRYSERKRLLRRMKEWDDTLEGLQEEKERGAKTRLLRWYYAAASITILLIAGILTILNLNRDYRSVASLYFKPYDHLPAATRGGNPNASSIEQILEYYDRGDYREAIMRLNTLQDSVRSELSDFILANAYQATEHYDQAIGIYENIISDGGAYVFPSKWYLSLCFLSVDEFERAKPVLDELARSNSSYSRNARELLEKLE